VGAKDARPLVFWHGDWDAFLELTREGATTGRNALEERLRAGMQAESGAVVARWDVRATAAALHWLGAEPPSSTLAALARLSIPTLLVLASKNDTAGPVGRFRAAVPHAAIETVESEHDLLSHAPAETIALVGD
jgi:hypothetical protein